MPKLTLTKISGFIKKDYPILLIGLLLLTIFGIYIFNLTKSKTIYNGEMWLGKIAPGNTTSEELKNKVGRPLETKIENSKIIYSYPTSNEKRQTKIDIAQDVVQLIQEPVIAKEKGILNDYISKFGNPEKVLYGKYSYASPANFWGDKGLIVFGNPISGLIIEVWYFAPTSLDEFLRNYPEFTLEPIREDL